MKRQQRLTVILTALMLVTAACASDAKSPAETPSTVTEALTTVAEAETTVAEAPTTVAEAETNVELCRPSQSSCLGELAPGTHFTAQLRSPISFTVPNGWSKRLDVPGSFNLQNEKFPSGIVAVIPDWVIATQDSCGTDPEPGVGRTVTDLVTWLMEHPGLITSTPEAISVGGLSGQVLDVRKDADRSGSCTGRVNLFTHSGTINDGGGWDINDSMRFRLYILDAGNGHTFTVHVETMDEEGFEAFAEAATPIVQGLTFLSDIGTVTITEDECVAALDMELTTGQLMFTVSNETTDTAAAEVFRLRQGHGFEVMEAHVEEERELADAGEHFAGPPLGQAAFASPGSGLMEASESRVVVIDGSEPGTYAIACFRHHPAVSDPVRLFAAIGPLEVQP
jgi:hypothetical protein